MGVIKEIIMDEIKIIDEICNLKIENNDVYGKVGDAEFNFKAGYFNEWRPAFYAGFMAGVQYTGLKITKKLQKKLFNGPA
jgi:hypothetical protein